MEISNRALKNIKLLLETIKTLEERLERNKQEKHQQPIEVEQ